MQIQMWELIAANRRKSWIIFFCMGAALLLLGYVIGESFAKSGGLAGIFIALVVWFILSLVSYFSGDSLVLFMSRAKEVSHEVHPQLFNVVEEMKIAASLPMMPKVYIMPDAAPNAFAVGKSLDKSAIVVTAGLLSRLNRDELQGVVAHEMSHILNRDVRFLTFAGILLGSIVLISEVFLRSLWFSGSSRRYRSRTSSSGGQAQLIMMVVSIVFAILAPIVARLLYLAISRKREYLADASAARLTRYPEGLASALEAISSNTLPLEAANKVTAPMFIVNPLLKKKSKVSALTSTHPPTIERIKILRSMHGAGFLDYQASFASVNAKSAPIIPKSALSSKEAVSKRVASVGGLKPRTTKESVRDVGDLIRAVNGYVFLTCACGLKIKLPSNYKKPRVSCPRCNRNIAVSPAEMVAVATAASIAAPATAEPASKKKNDDALAGASVNSYTRKGKGWESFSCACGATYNISPIFSAGVITCTKCGRKIQIKG